MRSSAATQGRRRAQPTWMVLSMPRSLCASTVHHSSKDPPRSGTLSRVEAPCCTVCDTTCGIPGPSIARLCGAWPWLTTVNVYAPGLNTVWDSAMEKSVSVTVTVTDAAPGGEVPGAEVPRAEVPDEAALDGVLVAELDVLLAPDPHPARVSTVASAAVPAA